MPRNKSKGKKDKDKAAQPDGASKASESTSSVANTADTDAEANSSPVEIAEEAKPETIPPTATVTENK